MSKFLTVSSDSDKLTRVCDSCNGIIKAPESWEEEPNEANILVGQFDHLALPPEQKANPNMTKRQRIAHEIFETELTYPCRSQHAFKSSCKMAINKISEGKLTIGSVASGSEIVFYPRVRGSAQHIKPRFNSHYNIEWSI